MVWLVPLPGTALYLPYRISVPTAFGSGTGEMLSFEVGPGQAMRSLRPICPRLGRRLDRGERAALTCDLRQKDASTGGLTRCGPDCSVAIGTIVSLVIAGIVVGLAPIVCRGAALVDPPWLKAHVGDGDGKISEVVLQRARALYLEKVSEGAARNPCYIAMDATRPPALAAGSTLSARPSGRSARFRRATATAAKSQASLISPTVCAAPRISAIRSIRS